MVIMKVFLVNERPGGKITLWGQIPKYTFQGNKVLAFALGCQRLASCLFGFVKKVEN